MNERGRLYDTFHELTALLLSCADWRRSWYKLWKLRRGRRGEVNTWKTWKSSTRWSSQGGRDIYEENPQGRLVFSFRLSRCPRHMVALDFSLIYKTVLSYINVWKQRITVRLKLDVFLSKLNILLWLVILWSWTAGNKTSSPSSPILSESKGCRYIIILYFSYLTKFGFKNLRTHNSTKSISNIKPE